MTGLVPMPFGGKDVPHLVIEVNQMCNVSCASCYKHKRPSTKPAALVEEEIDLGARERRLDMITLAGGEPTLHPDLPRIIRHIARKGIKVNLLTNGCGLTDEQLRAYRASGLTRVVFHVDSMQTRPDVAPSAGEAELNACRRALLERAARQGLRGGLAITAYRKNLDEVPAVIDFALRTPQVSLVLITCCGRFAPIAERHGSPEVARRFREAEPTGQEVTSRELAAVVERTNGLEPCQYIGSSSSDDERRWLFYLGFVVAGPGARLDTLFLSSRFRRTLRLGNALQKLLKGRYKFDMVPGPASAVAVCVLYGVLGADLANLLRTGWFLSRRGRRGARLGSKVIVVQQPPNLTPDGEIEVCRNCPDATVRNGRIMPLCLADIVSPLP
jgi:hypothetical protein